MSKRLFDVLAALFGLIILLPFFALIALWIKVDSAGPIFFRQERIGRYGVPFKIHKFRSMVVDAEKSGSLTVGSDSRITCSGHFLRKTKVDELPQLFDVLIGRMSFVGPRPEVKEFINFYPYEVREKILSVRPGITDKASIVMVDENELLAQFKDSKQAYIDIILPMKQAYYLDYVDKQSLLLDLQLIFLTFKKIVTR